MANFVLTVQTGRNNNNDNDRNNNNNKGYNNWCFHARDLRATCILAKT